uniref:Glycosyltransferase family 92 protein n=1 Tax=viral metagenome TaxID=1070528 RepID=A0A6C0J380_9ZZZZ
MKYCIYTRLYYESPYILFFIEHYIKLGFDKIIILKSDNIIFNNTFENNVDIYNVNNDENKLLSIYTKFIKNTKYDWVLIVDIDEILFLNPKYNTINDYVQNKLIKNSDINTFYFRWAMLEKYDNFEINSFKSLLNDYTMFQNSHIKSMVKISSLKSVYHPHLCELNEDNCIYFENNILNKQIAHNHLINKLSYKETILVHIHTRNLNNLILKSFTTNLGNNNNVIPKQIKNKLHFVHFINNFDFENIKYEILLKQFKSLIGLKATLPFTHSRTKEIDFKSLDYKINNYQNKFVNYPEEKQILEKVLIENNINIKNFYRILDILSIYIYKTNYFMKIIHKKIVNID